MVVPLHLGWRTALFANWRVDPGAVAERIPRELVVDTYDGSAWLTIFPFTNVDVRPAFLPRGTGIRLPEINVRTYVTHRGRAGIYFFSLDAAGLAGVLGARLTHFLPYYYAKIDLVEEADRIAVRGRRSHPGARPARFEADYRPIGERFRAEEGTLEYFLAERYRLLTESPTGAMRRVEAEHSPWPLYEAEVEIYENTLFEATGFPAPDAPPLCLYSPGVDTVVSPSRWA